MQYLACFTVAPGAGKKFLRSDDQVEIDRFVKAMDREGWSVFYAPNPLISGALHHGAETIAGIRYLFVDVDMKDLDEDADAVARTLRALPVTPTTIVNSGHGFHVIWELKEQVDRADVAYRTAVETQEKLIDWLAADRAVRPWSVIRRPGTTNFKRQPYIKCEEIFSGSPVELADLVHMVGDVTRTMFRRKEQQTNGHDADPVTVEERLASMRYEGAGDASFHKTELSATASLISRGSSVTEAVDEVLRAAQKTAQPGWDWDAERLKLERQCYDWIQKKPEFIDRLPDGIRQTYRDKFEQGQEPIFRYRKGFGWQVLAGWGKKSKPEEPSQEQQSDGKKKLELPFGWQLVDTDNIVSPKWLIKHLLPEEGIVIIPGQWGVYKTTVLLELAYCLMSGQAFADQYKVKKPCSVMFYALEGSKLIPNRLAAIKALRGNTARLPLYVAGECPPLSRPESAQKIVDHAKLIDQISRETNGLPVGIIFVDTYSMAAGHTGAGDDNDRSATQKVFSTLRRITHELGVCVAVVDHYGKAVEAGTTGSSGKEGNADAVLANLGERDMNGSLANMRMVIRKQRDGQSGVEIPFEPEVVELKIDEDGEPITACALTFGKPRDAQAGRKLSPNDMLLSKAVDEAMREQSTSYMVEPGVTVPAVSEEYVRDVFYESHPRGSGTEQQNRVRRANNFAGAVKRAVTVGRLVRRDTDEGVVLYRKPDDRG